MELRRRITPNHWSHFVEYTPLAGAIGTLFFGVLSVVLYLHSRKFKRLDAVWSSSTLQSKRHPDVRILFRDAEVEDLSRMRVLFINSGTEPILRSDFARSAGAAIHLTPTTSATKFFSAACLAGDFWECGAECLSAPDFACFGFDFLNPGQRVVVEVLYSGESPTIQTTLIGGAIRIRKYSSVSRPLVLASMLTTFALMIGSVAVMFGLSKFMNHLHVQFSDALASALFFVVLLPAVVVGVDRANKLISRLHETRRQRALENHLGQ